MLDKVVVFLTEYLKGKPFTDVLIILGIGVFMWAESGHGDRTENAHKVLHTILQERDANEQLRTEANERNTDRIISALTGVKQEVKKIPAAAAAAAERLHDTKVDSSPPGLESGPCE